MTVKICGVTSADELSLLDGVDLAGVWCGVAGGRSDLTVARAAGVMAACAGTRVRPVLVTLLTERAELCRVVRRTGAGIVQLHGFAVPALVRALKQLEVTVLTVLHVQAGRCVQEALIPAYERAGTDGFILDAMSDGARVGSTGTAIDSTAALAVADRLTRPFLLAGGITAGHRDHHAAVVAHPLFRGVDIDSAARDPEGRLDEARIKALTRVWRREATT